MKKLELILVMVLVLIIPFGLVGCKKNVKKIEESRFITVEEYNNKYYILVDKETKVCYLKHMYANQYGLTVLVDENGKPILYEGEI